MAQHNELGKKGEELAVAHLKKNGYDVLHNNWRWQKAELDIIAEKDGFVVFVEVKTRQSRYFGDPETFISKRKQKLLVKAAHAYMEAQEEEKEARFDVISVVTNSKFTQLEHIEDAFYPLA